MWMHLQSLQKLSHQSMMNGYISFVFWAPPTSEPSHSKQQLGKAVPTWGKGRMLSWHGTTPYTLSACLFTGLLAPSEKDIRGHAVAAGRGVYTSTGFCSAARHAVPWLPDPAVNHCYKVVLLVAIPGSAGAGGEPFGQSTPPGQKELSG